MCLSALRHTAFYILDHLLPLRNDYWCFATWHGSYPHTMDNPRAVFEEIKNDPAIVKIVLLKPNRHLDKQFIEGRNVVAVNVESLRGAYYLARAKIVMTGYGLSGLCSYASLISTRHKIVQLWHGIPLKRIGKLFPGEKYWDAETPRYAATVCSSEQDQTIMAAAFAPLAKENVWLCGLPRNDLFLKTEPELPLDYLQHLNELRRRMASRRFVLYAPTWREGEDGIYAFSSQQLTKLDEVLKKHNAALGIRAHANRRIESAFMQGSDAIFFVNDLPDVNVLLRATDVLVTDYSSIYIDFLLTGRPILHFTYDIDSYVKERGFLYEIDEAVASTWFRTFDELIARLDDALAGKATDVERYANAKRLFHTHSGASAAAATQKIKLLAES